MIFCPLRELPPIEPYTAKDTLVIFGEVFQRGYVNGMVDEARRLGMNVIYSTVGRRDQGILKPLNKEELKEKNQAPLINVPLEAGFDLEPWESENSLVQQLSKYKMSEWKDISINFNELEYIISLSRKKFRARTQAFIESLKSELPPDGNIIFAHTMAGGIPRAKLVMPAMNRIFKGIGERFQSSKEFIETDLGKICLKSFNEVTAETFNILIEETKELRQQRKKGPYKVSYTAFGYHGCEALAGNKYVWQSYAPYLQGWAKIRLEEIATQSFKNNIQAGVFNAPEILTNSSSVFLGVEVCLYPLLTALRKEGLPADHYIFKDCESRLNPEYTLSDIEGFAQDYLDHDATAALSQMDSWPHHNDPQQMEKMRTASQQLIDMHRDKKDLMAALLSEIVFKACGGLMVHKAYNLQKPVWWLGHDIVARWTAEKS